MSYKLRKLAPRWFAEGNGVPVIRDPVKTYGGTWAKGHPIGVVFHYTAGCGSDLSGTFQERRVSAHFSVGRDGEVRQYVPLTEVAWHADKANPYYYGIEHAALPGRCDLTDAQLETSAKLAAALVEYAKRKWDVDIPLRKIEGPDLVSGFHDHSDGDGVIWNLNGHTDRLYGWTWERYLRRVQAHLTPYELLDVTKVEFRRFAKLDEALQAVRKRVGSGHVVRLRDLRAAKEAPS